MARVITFKTMHPFGQGIDVTPKQLAMYRDAGWPHPVVPGVGSYPQVYMGEHPGLPTYTDAEVRAFVAALPRRG